MPKHRYDRRAWRCAYLIQDTLRLTRQTMQCDHARWVHPVVEQLPPIARSSARLARAVSHRGFSAAPRTLTERVLRQLHTTTRDMRALADQLVANAMPPVPPLRDLLGELDQLESEFGGWDLDAPASELSVTTEPIRLEGVDLGPFTIRLRLGQPITQLMGRLCWVEALEPNPAASNQEVTHPHVSGEAVCVGDVGPELIRALRSGRVCDFFLMIRSILTTYNPDSPYVPLDEWYGEPCADCGRSTNEDGHYCCEACDRRVCDDCISGCPHCDTSICFGCVTMCHHCKESSCAECLTACNDCGALVCPDCTEDDLCPTCLENLHDEDDLEDNNEEENLCEEETRNDCPPQPSATPPSAEEPTTPTPAVHTHRVGETALPLPPR